MSEAGSARPRVVFIAGCGRSGSTLLEHVLGELDGFVAVGELRAIWRQGFGQNVLCGCGQPFRDCPFWRAVVRRAFGSFEAIDPVAVEAQRKRIDHPLRLPLLASPWAPRNERAQGADYTALMASLYAAIAEVAGARVIIDSSKEPAAALVASGSRAIELSVIHLVRDSRAVAFSWGRRRQQPVAEGRSVAMPRQAPWVSAAVWLYRNIASELLPALAVGAPAGGRLRLARLRYEDFVASPRASLERLLAALELPASGLAGVLDGNVARLEPKHLIWGNPMRFRSGPIALELDAEWRRASGAAPRRLVTLLTAPLLWRYGYLSGSGD